MADSPRDALRMAGYLLDATKRRHTQPSQLAVSAEGDKVKPVSHRAVAWSMAGAIIACAALLRTGCVATMKQATELFRTKNFESHWDGTLSCPRWTRDQMVEILKNA